MSGSNSQCGKNPSSTFRNATITGSLLVQGRHKGQTSEICHLAVVHHAEIERLAVADTEVNAVIGPIGTIVGEGQVLFQTLQEAVDDAQQWDLGEITLNLTLPTGTVRQNFTETLAINNSSSESRLVINGPLADQFGFGHIQGHPHPATDVPAALGGGGAAVIVSDGVSTLTVTYPAGVNPNYATLATPVLAGDQLTAYSAVTGLVTTSVVSAVAGNVITLTSTPPDLTAQGSAFVFSPRITTTGAAIDTSSRVHFEHLQFDYTAALVAAINVTRAESVSGSNLVIRQLVPSTASNVAVRLNNNFNGASLWRDTAIFASQGHLNLGANSTLSDSTLLVLPGGPAGTYGARAAGAGHVHVLNSFVGGAPPAQGTVTVAPRLNSFESALLLADQGGRLRLESVDLLLNASANVRAAAIAAAANGRLWGSDVVQTSLVPAAGYVGPLAHSWQNGSLVVVDAVSTLDGPAAGNDAAHFVAQFGSRLSLSGSASSTSNGDIGIHVLANSQASGDSTIIGAPLPTLEVAAGLAGDVGTYAANLSNISEVGMVGTISYTRM